MSEEEGGGGGGHGGPVWLLTYCDLITLLVAFFVMMIAFSTINVNKCKEEMPKIGESFAGGEFMLEGGMEPVNVVTEKDIETTESPGAEEIPVENQPEPEELYDYISGFMHDSGLKKVLDVEDVKVGCKIKIPVDLCFEKGESVLRKDAYTIFDKLAIVLRILSGRIVIDANMGKTAKEVDLAINRAANICEFLVTREDIEPHKVAIAGYHVAAATENMINITMFKK